MGHFYDLLFISYNEITANNRVDTMKPNCFHSTLRESKPTTYPVHNRPPADFCRLQESFKDDRPDLTDSITHNSLRVECDAATFPND